MSPPRVRCVLTVDDGTSRQVGASGLMIGREPDCDLVVVDPRASRRHALIRLTTHGAELVPLGRTPVELGGKPVDRPTALASGDRLALPGLSAQIDITLVAAAAGRGRVQLQRPGGSSFGLGHSPFVLGGGERDDLIVKRWPAGAVELHVGADEVHLEATVEGVTIDDQPVPLGELCPLGPGARLALAGEVFVVSAPDPGVAAATTALAQAPAVPSRVVVETLPRGGRVFFTMPGGQHAVYLADRRLDLLICLLQPAHGQAGDYVTDDVLRARVWPRSSGGSRQEINMLISRCRRDLLEAGLPARLLERSPGGGGTRLVVQPGAEIVVG